MPSRTSPRSACNVGRAVAVAAFVAIASTFVLSAAFAQPEASDGAWELRFCAAPFNPPMSDRSAGGYDVDIAEILADELGATATFEWVQFDDEGIRRSLHAGTCDVVIGIGESVSGVINTVPYLRAPYVFAWRTGEDPGIRNLDDPAIADLSVGTYQTGVPSIALRNRGLEGSIREFAPIASAQGPDRHTPVIDALLDGTVDLAIVYAPMVAERERQAPGSLTYVPVEPELELGASIIQFFRIWTIGVRPNDEALRNLLNHALAERWDDVQDAIAAYGIPQLSVSRSRAAPPPPPGTTRVGLIVPTRTPYVHGYEAVGEAARRGAVLAENSIARVAERRDVAFELLVAAAPSEDAMVRAAERLVHAEGVAAIIGGFTPAQVERMGAVVAEGGAVLLNIGAQEDALRNDVCSPTTFHVEASTAMYVDAVVEHHSARGGRSWFVVGDGSASLADRVGRAVQSHDANGDVVGAATVEPGQFAYFDELQAIRATGADTVLVNLGAQETDQFVSQLEIVGLDVDVAIVPSQRGQTRELLYRYLQGAPRHGAGVRPVLWDPAFDVEPAADLNDRYASRNGEPMESAAWAAYAAVLILFEAASVEATGSVDELIAYLTDPETAFDVDKGAPVSFRPWDRQLRQPLVLVEPVSGAEWGSRASTRIALAAVVGTAPPDLGGDVAVADLDRYGDAADASVCAF